MGWTRKTWAVNSKRLLDEISSMIEEGLSDMGVIWGSDTHRDSFVELIDQWLEEKYVDGLIEQWNVVCDFRNNKVIDMEEGKFVFDIYYRQMNCLNVTHIQYVIQDKDDDDDQMLLEFVI